MIGIWLLPNFASIALHGTQGRDLPDSYVGVFENKGKDIRLVINRFAYRLESGAPSTLPTIRRHVDYEYGSAFLKAGKILLERKFLFKSPSRSTYYDLFGWGKFEGYQREFPSHADQRRLVKELNWRVNTHLSFQTAIVRTVGSRPKVIVHGIPLDKVDSLKYLIDALPDGR